MAGFVSFSPAGKKLVYSAGHKLPIVEIEGKAGGRLRQLRKIGPVHGDFATSY